MKLIVILSFAIFAAGPARAEEKFQEQVEDAMRTLRPNLAPPVLSTAPVDEGRITLRFSRSENESWRDVATMSMSLKTFERYRQVERRFREDERIFGRELDPSRYYKFGGRDAAAVADVLFKSLSEDPFVQAHPWLDEPVGWVVEGMRLFDRLDRGSPWDIFGFEVDDWISDRFGVGLGRGRSERGFERGPEGFRSDAPSGLGLGGPIQGSPDGDFHGRLRFGLSGLEKAATKFEADPLRVKVKYEIRCPRSFVLDKVEIGGEVRPFCRGEEGKDFRLYIGGGKNF